MIEKNLHSGEEHEHSDNSGGINMLNLFFSDKSPAELVDYLIKNRP